MRVQMVGTIQVRGDKHLIPITPKPLCQLDSNLMGNLRRSFSGGKRLVSMIGNDAILLAVEFLDLLHLCPCCAWMAVDPGNESKDDFLTILCLRLTGFMLRDGVVNDIGKVICTLIEVIGDTGGLFLVFNIVQHLSNASMDTPN